MKPVLILTLSFIPLFAFLTNLPLAFSNNSDDLVRDTNGKQIFPGREYYILPTISSPTSGGGLKLGKTGNSYCPLTVLQDLEGFRGHPVRFNIPGISPGIIFTGAPVDIEFALINKPPCTRSTKWWVFVDKEIKEAYVAIDPEVHPYDEELIIGTFNIQKYKFGGYKLMFCVTKSGTCWNIAGFNAGGENGRRLILSDSEHEAFNVVFVDAFNLDGVIKSVV